MKIFVLLFTFVISTQSFAQDHLEPEESIFSGMFLPEYYLEVVKAYSEIYENEYIARTIVFPSFQPEYAIALKKENDEYKVVHIVANGSFWGKLMSGENDKKYELNRNEKTITSKVAENIISVWEEMLLRTRYKDYRKETIIGLDGTTFHFSFTPPQSPGDRLAGKIWSPDVNSPTGFLVGISHDMVAHAGGDARAMSKLESKLEKLKEILKKKEK